MPFPPSLAFSLLMEGGYANDPADRGGATRFGITAATLAASRGRASVTPAEVRALSLREAAGIYERDYWQPAGCLLIADDAVALCHFDAAVHHGPRRAVRLLQGACGVHVTGLIGPDTRAAMATARAAEVVPRYLEARAAFLRGIVARDVTQRRFLAGWLARCRHVARECGVVITPSLQLAAEIVGSAVGPARPTRTTLSPLDAT